MKLSCVLGAVILGFALIGVISLTVGIFFATNARHFNSKYDGGYVQIDGDQSKYVVFEPEPIWQEKPHTCGFLAISAIYNSYLLDTEALNLRHRLGVDAHANIFDPTSLGTIHPDIYRVMYQDGFALTDLDLSDNRWAPKILAHIYNRHLVLLLIKRPQSGNLHWVLAADPRDDSSDTLLIIDSLSREPFTVEVSEFVDQYVVSALLVFCPANPDDIDAMTLNAMGAASAAKALNRM